MNLFKSIPSVSIEEWVCPIYNGPQESIQHLFLGSIFARAIWRASRWPLDTGPFSNLPIEVQIKAILNPHGLLGIPKKEVLNFQILVNIALHAIWWDMNNKV